MINRIILVSLVYLSVAGGGDILSQTSLSFHANYEGVSYPLDSIEIRNINNTTKIVKYYPDNQLDLVATGIDNIFSLGGDQFQLSQNYPNPFYNHTRFDISLSHSQRVFISISTVYGQQVLKYEIQLSAGINHFELKGSNDKLFFLTVKSSTYSAGIMMINSGFGNGSLPELKFLGVSANIQKKHSQNKKSYLKSGDGGLEYSIGDSLSFTGYITRGRLVLSQTIGDRPMESKAYVFNFIKESRIVILMYHDLVEGVGTDEYERNIIDFENDLIYIRDNYQILSMDDLLLLKSGDLELTRDGVIVTFDDGYRSTYDLGFPLLKEYNVPATVFVVAEWMDTRPYLTWNEVWLMSECVHLESSNFISIGSHTSSHPFLEKSEQYFNTHGEYMDFLNIELGDSKHWIVDISAQPDIFLALPYGDGAYNQDIINSAVENGYKGIRTSVWNSFTVGEVDLFALPSIPILSDSSIDIIEYYFDL